MEMAQELHVLAVDDSHVDRKVIERLLKISCCKVTAVESGTRALQYLGLDGEKSSMGIDGLKVNLILTDYSMPGMTGYELLKKIKSSLTVNDAFILVEQESSVLSKIPVVIMSSEKILPRIDRCLEEGAEEFLLKPVKLSDVKRLRDFILRGEGDDNKETEKNIKQVCSRKRKFQDDLATQSMLSAVVTVHDIELSSPESSESQQPLSKQSKIG
ncbi:hypothetical protein H5410_018101 [Solanum commersonii]|uniref:Response regulatory domain-containing protein n=1 Tax=Solanum commersonii TaxID=4109 RepID=A0A9J6A123_SOLCO|nr:hypothetical protein H5410_018101 [Solanum commersonii]